MIAVAVLATFAIPCQEWQRRRVHYLRQAAMHSRMEQQYVSAILFGDPRRRNNAWKVDMMALTRKHSQRLLDEERLQNRSMPQLMFRGDVMDRAMDLAMKEARQIEDPLARVRHEEKRRADYHAALRRKFERAARFPWLTVLPDPPPPIIH
jgi:hypothetical protein